MTQHTPDPLFPALSSFDLVLVTLYGEVRAEPIEGIVAVANVLRNRTTDGRWGSSYHSVALAWAQFSCLWPQLGGINYIKVRDFARRVKDVSTFNAHERQLRLIVQGLFSDSLIDNTHGATHYYGDYIPAPAWVNGATRTAKFGPHIFFSGVK